MNAPEGASRLPQGLTVTGELSAQQDIIIDGAFDGQVTLVERELTIGPTAQVTAKVVARSVVVAGRLDGSIMATERVTLAETAVVTAHLQTKSLVMKEGAQFTGTVDPERTAAALQVARYRQTHPAAG